MPDTYISQFSGEEIDSALRAAQIISGASTLAELREKLEIRGDTIPVSAEDSTLISEALTKIPTTSGGGVNPNLLDNWYFGNPVNQRGQTEYTAAGYTVDRWKLSQWNTDEVAAKLKKTGLNISGSAEGKANSTYIEENIDFPFAGKTVTISAIISEINKNSNTLSLFLRANNTLLHSCPIKSTGLVSTTYTFANDFDGIVGFEIGQGGSEGGLGSCDFTIIAAKLELGDTQTLAHKENEKWVLNEIPDFGEQLRRCQRYFVRLINAYGYGWTYSSSVANFLVPLPTTLRANPVVKFTKNGEIQTINGSKAVTSFEAKGIHPNGLAIDLHNSANALISGTPVTWHDSSMDISADL
jgi:hypothetical protein